MTDLTLDAGQLSRLSRFASVLIPAAANMPAAADVDGYAALLQLAVKASGYSVADLSAAVAGVPESDALADAKAYAAADPARFDIAATIASGAYFMSPMVLERLGYPLERRHPAGVEEFADEYETGILDPVIARGPRFRDPR